MGAQPFIFALEAVNKKRIGMNNPYPLKMI